MPTVNLFGIPVVLLSQLGSIYIDSMDEVTVILSSTVTKNPTEAGVNITDHIVNLPTVIRMAGRFVDAPLTVGGISIYNPANPLSALTERATGLEGGLSIQKIQEMAALREAKTLVDVSIQQGVYANMAFEVIEAPRQKGDGTSQRFRATLTEIITTELLAADATDLGVVSTVAWV